MNTQTVPGSCPQCGERNPSTGMTTCGRSECQQGSACDNHHRVKSRKPCPAREGCKLLANRLWQGVKALEETTAATEDQAVADRLHQVADSMRQQALKSRRRLS